MVDSSNSFVLKQHQYYVIAISAQSMIGERTKSLDQIHIDMSIKYPAFCEKYLKEWWCSSTGILNWKLVIVIITFFVDEEESLGECWDRKTCHFNCLKRKWSLVEGS